MAENYYSGVGLKSVSLSGGLWADYQKWRKNN